jgi:hypothetical protein
VRATTPADTSGSALSVVDDQLALDESECKGRAVLERFAGVARRMATERPDHPAVRYQEHVPAGVRRGYRLDGRDDPEA